MRCPICSTKNDEKAKECIACGYVFIAEEETPESWVLESASLDDSDVDGYGQSVSARQEKTVPSDNAEQNEPDGEQAETYREERIEQEDGMQVSVITITVPSVDRTTADTDYVLHTDSLLEKLPEEEAAETEKTSKRVAKAIKAPLTARETAMLISVAIMALLLLSVVGYFLVSGKLAESIRNFTAPPAAESTEDAKESDTETAPPETETATEEAAAAETSGESSEEESSAEMISEESTEETFESETVSEPEIVIEGGVVFYANSMIFAETDGGYALMTYTGEEPIAVIPEEIAGTPVVEILDRAFADRSDITQIQIPQGVRAIDSNAFYGCSSLAVLALPASLEFIGNNAFDYTGPFMVISPAGTFAQQYCQQMNIPWAQGDGLLENGQIPEASVIGQESAAEPQTEAVPETAPAETEESQTELRSEAAEEIPETESESPSE